MARKMRLVPNGVPVTAFEDHEWRKALDHIMVYFREEAKVPEGELAEALSSWAEFLSPTSDVPRFGLADCSQAVSDHTTGG